jgi:hypothetical protein
VATFAQMQHGKHVGIERERPRWNLGRIHSPTVSARARMNALASASVASAS